MWRCVIHESGSNAKLMSEWLLSAIRDRDAPVGQRRRASIASSIWSQHLDPFADGSADQAPGQEAAARTTATVWPIRKLVVRFAVESPTWRCDRIGDALGNPGIAISDQSVGNILKECGIPPAGERGARRKRWRHFIAAHWQTLASCDFCPVPVISFGGFYWSACTPRSFPPAGRRPRSCQRRSGAER